MTAKQLELLEEATSKIFKVEQQWRRNGQDYAADTLYRARTEINNARSRG